VAVNDLSFNEPRPSPDLDLGTNWVLDSIMDISSNKPSIFDAAERLDPSVPLQNVKSWDISPDSNRASPDI
jgi:hypothetical protein